jgi:hypothetical protein
MDLHSVPRRDNKGMTSHILSGYNLTDLACKASTFARRLLAEAKNTLENVSTDMDKLGVAKDILKGIIDLAVAVAAVRLLSIIQVH